MVPGFLFHLGRRKHARLGDKEDSVEHHHTNTYPPGEHYRAFGADVRTLSSNLGQLETAIQRAQKSLISHGAREHDILGGDPKSLSEIVGDYEATLKECQKLLWDNRLYGQKTGPTRNIGWSLMVMPQVDHLRRRIQMHNIRIQHVLRPFEM